MTLHAAWKMDTRGRVGGARTDISLIKFFGAKVLHDVDRPRAAGPRLARLLDRPAARGDVPLRARPRASTTAPTRSTAQSVARQILRGYEPPRRRRARPSTCPTRRAAAREQVRRPARGGDGQRLRRATVRLGCAASRCRSCSSAALSSPSRLALTRRRRRPVRATAPPSPAATRRPLRRAARASRLAARRSRSASARRARRRCGALAERLRAALPDGRFEPVPGHRGLRNVVGDAARAAGPRSCVGAHYDTTRPARGFVGANDGAGGHGVGGRARARRSRRPKRPRGRAARCASCSSTARRRRRPARGQTTSSTRGLRGSQAVRAAPRRRARAGDGPARLHRQQGPAPPARGHLDAGAVGAAARRGRTRVGVGAVFPDEHRHGDHRRPHAVPARRDPGDRPHRLDYPGYQNTCDTLDKLVGAQHRRRRRDGRSSSCTLRRVDAAESRARSSACRTLEPADAPSPPRSSCSPRPRGYCAGVDRAVQTVERALELYGAPVYVRKEIVHNKHVVEQLRERGAIFVEELDDTIPEGAITVFSAHGVSPAVHADAERARAADDRRDLPAGDQGPPRGASSSPPRATRSSSSATPATRRSRARWARRPSTSCSSRPRPTSTRSRSPIPSKVAYISQTTLSVDETRAIINRLRERFPDDHRAAHRRHLLRHDQPPGGRQADGRAVRPRARHRLAQLVELQAPRRGRARLRRRLAT